MYRHKGFTLIELITVIAILGALAVIALPRFINLQDEAEQAATEGVAGSLAAGSAVNLAGVLAGDTANAVQVTSCADVPNTLSDPTLPDGYQIGTGGSGFPASPENGDPGECVVENTNLSSTISVTFTGYYASF